MPNETTGQALEFATDWHRDAYIDGLKHERVGYEARKERDLVFEDEVHARVMDRRLAQVTDELVRLGVEQALEPVKAPAKPKEPAAA